MTDEEKKNKIQRVKSWNSGVAGENYYPTNIATRNIIGTDAYDFIMALYDLFIYAYKKDELTYNDEFFATRKKIQEKSGLNPKVQKEIENAFINSRGFVDMLSVRYDEKKQLNYYKFNPDVWIDFVRMCDTGKIRVTIKRQADKYEREFIVKERGI